MTTTGRSEAGWAEWMERLVRAVPGVGRYQDREGLRDTDKQVREHLANRLTDLTRIIEGAERRLTEVGRLDRLPALDRVTRLVSTLADRIRHASYGFAGVFDLRKIRETELVTLHRLDLDLLEAVPCMREPILALAEAASDDTAFLQALQTAEGAMQALEDRLAARDTVACRL